jgi:hypothetical protein
MIYMKYIGVCAMVNDHIRALMYVAPENVEPSDELAAMYSNMSEQDSHEILGYALIDESDMFNELVALMVQFSSTPHVITKSRFDAGLNVQKAAILALVNGYINGMMNHYDTDTHSCTGSWEDRTVMFVHDGNAEGLCYQVYEKPVDLDIIDIFSIYNSNGSIESLQASEIFDQESMSNRAVDDVQGDNIGFGSMINEIYARFIDGVFSGEIRFDGGPIGFFTKDKVHKYRMEHGYLPLDYEAERYEEE